MRVGEAGRRGSITRNSELVLSQFNQLHPNLIPIKALQPALSLIGNANAINLGQPGWRSPIV